MIPLFDQMALVEEILGQDLDAIIGWEFSPTSAYRILQAGLSIVHTAETSFSHPLFVSPSSLYDVAHKLGAYLARLLGRQGNVLIIGGVLEAIGGDDGSSRLDGLAHALRQHPAIQVRHISSGWEYQQAYQHVYSITQEISGPIHAVVGLSDPLALAWGDLNGDNRLDLVTGSYDAELNLELGNTFLFGGGAGVFNYEHQEARTFTAQRLAIILPDLNADSQPDILVGNDFDMPDAAWVREGESWTASQLFGATSHSTMSYDVGDTNNDTTPEIVSTDMKPYNIAVPTLASWLPVMASMPQKHHADDPQVMENVLQVRAARGQFTNQALSRGLAATGWSWSAKFGDLDSDGFLDFYAVNGMIAFELFHHLPGDELVEQNQALRNQGDGTFAPAPGWNLGSTASGRGMSMADLDNDGDLDIVVNNLRSPAQLFVNQLCDGSSLEVELAWPDSKNTRALGAQLVLHTSAGRYTRDVRAGSGYLSGDPARIHFGFPAEAALQQLDIHWPDGAISQVDMLAHQRLLTIKR